MPEISVVPCVGLAGTVGTLDETWCNCVSQGYVGSIPSFVGLYHGFKVLAYAGRNEEFSTSVVVAAAMTVLERALQRAGLTGLMEHDRGDIEGQPSPETGARKS